MLYTCYILTSLLSAAAALLLYSRQAAVHAEVSTLTRRAPRRRVLDELFTGLAGALDESLSVRLDGRGLAGCRLRYLDADDAHKNAATLLAAVAAGAAESSAADLVRATYQLAFTLDIPLARLGACLDVLAGDLKARSGGRVARVETVSPGDLVDRRTMDPLGYGLRVQHPLGVIAYDAEGNVVLRASVIN